MPAPALESEPAMVTAIGALIFSNSHSLLRAAIDVVQCAASPSVELAWRQPLRQRHIDELPQRARRGGGILNSRQRRNDGNAVGASSDDGASVTGVDTGDTDNGNIPRTVAQRNRNAGEPFGADRCSLLFFRQRCVDAADPGIVEEFGGRVRGFVD